MGANMANLLVIPLIVCGLVSIIIVLAETIQGSGILNGRMRWRVILSISLVIFAACALKLASKICVHYNVTTLFE